MRRMRYAWHRKTGIATHRTHTRSHNADITGYRRMQRSRHITPHHDQSPTHHVTSRNITSDRDHHDAITTNTRNRHATQRQLAKQHKTSRHIMTHRGRSRTRTNNNEQARHITTHHDTSRQITYHHATTTITHDT